MSTLREKRIQISAQWLYSAMPGSPPVPQDESGENLWTAVDGTAHYLFCDRIARLIDGVDTSTHVEAD